ncbi:membrane protein insertase YidC [Alsobacter metallidurans]|uniref:Membrane protein insertase YidC n=1 Tax=Alsobacter metallidurans TaxID=340221 RepID=A0A917I443_9HYPH|nr:membrane protein insertase YidC [Alsobacter metallidurans]GGH08879.1 membrane protein insertase YidC [Alsobacter metallidurans]
MQDNKNFFLAIALSLAVLIGWNVFFGVPTMDKAKQDAAQNAKVAAQNSQGPIPGASPQTNTPPSESMAVIAPTRDMALMSSPRVKIETARVRGSINLRGGDVDDIALKDYHETVDRQSPNIVVFSPAGGPEGYFARLGWLPAPGAAVDVPLPNTVWTADGQTLTEAKPVTLTWDNGKGLVFKRLIAIDGNYMLTVTDSVEARDGTTASLTPYGFVRRIGKPVTQGYYILHEGLLGILGEQGLKEEKYDSLEKEAALSATEKGKSFPQATGGWVGMTDKYWAAALIPDQKAPYTATFSSATPPGGQHNFQTLLTLQPQTVQPGTAATSTTRLFVGAKEVNTIDGYQNTLGIERFKLLIDWGWFWFITQPMFKLLDGIFKLVGNFGIAILVVTVIVKAIFFPLANKSYSSMAKMKAVQPQMQALREQYPDDKVKQQQELMELYKREKINPVAGCLPVVIQIPVFFALYKVLFVTIEMRHAPFFGWIKDLAAPDPTSIFNLFGLIPWTPPHVLMIGIWPLIMGVTMFVQMKMNPEPTDPVQKTMFTWMPVFFTYLLASFPAGLVIYWSWNNLLSVSQQYLIMKRQGVKVELWDNLRGAFKKAPPKPVAEAKTDAKAGKPA